MVIRWLGAFRHKRTYSLDESLNYELSNYKVVAAEQLQNGRSYISAKVGLLSANKSVLKRFRQDVWSEYSKNGILKPTRKQNDDEVYSHHQECFIKQGNYLAIVIQGKVKEGTMQTCKQIACKFDLKLVKLSKGKLITII